MVKARKEEDGSIKIYGTLPSKFRGKTGNYAGGFHLLDEETIQAEGFYDLVIPEFNRFTEMLGEIYFDEVEEFFTYEVNPKPDLPTIEEAKKNKISELKKLAKDKFNETDWYYIRELHFQKKEKSKSPKFVPEEVIQEREWVYAVVEYKEAEINVLQDLESVLAYEVNLDIDMTELEKPAEEILPEKILSEEIVEEKTEEILTESPVDGSEIEEVLPEENTTETSVSEIAEEEIHTKEAGSGEVLPEENTTEIPTEEKVIEIIREEKSQVQSDNNQEEDTPLETIKENIEDVISKISRPISLAIAKQKDRSLDRKANKKKINMFAKNIKNKSANNKIKVASKKTKNKRA